MPSDKSTLNSAARVATTAGPSAPKLGRRAFLRAAGLTALAAAGGIRPPPSAAASNLLAFAQSARGGPSAGLALSSPPESPLEAAAGRALDALLARLDPEAGYRPRFLLDLDAQPAALVHYDYWDGVDLAGRSVDALVRLRRMLGADDAGQAESALRNYFLGRQGPLGLFYNEPAGDTAVADSFCQSRALQGLTTWLGTGGPGDLEARLEALVGGLAAIAQQRGDYSYFPGLRYQGRWLDYGLTRAEAYDGRESFGYGGQCALPLLEYHALTGSHRALALAERLLRHFVAHAGLVDDAGRFAGETHAEGYLPMAAAAVRYGVVSGDERYVAWADRLYQWVRANSSEFGWVPGPLGLDAAYFAAWYGTPVRRTCETCSIADAIELAILLARQGYPAYWDDVERFTRNQLLENQFGTAAARALVARGDVDPEVLVALAGAWESFALPYRLLARPDNRRLLEGCCSAAGARALSLVWEQAVERRPEALYVHLGFTRNSPWAEVRSYEPAVGRLDVVMHEPLSLRLRVPSWVAPGTTALWLDGAQRELRWDGTYLALDTVAAGSRVSLRYPLAERVEGFSVNDETTLAYWRGGTVVDVLPDQGPAPIYQRRELPYTPVPDSPGSATHPYSYGTI